MRVEAVELRRVRIPLRRAFEHAAHQRDHADAVFVAIQDDAGNVGWGEVQPRPYVTGETIEGVLERTGPELARSLLGRELPTLPAVTAWLDAAAEHIGRNLAALCGFDLALLDVAGQHFGVPVSAVLGGVLHDPLPAGVIVGFEHETASLARYCATLRLAGKRHVKIKVGRDDDVARVQAVAKVWKNTALRLDANAAWTADEAIERLLAIAAVAPVASIEQPVPAADFAGMRRIREATGIKVMADESICSLADARRLVQERAADIFNVRLGKNGGLLASRRLVEFARQAGVAVHLGTMVGESGVLSRAAEVFGRCVEGFECLDGKGQNAFLLEVDILEDRSEYPPESGPGLGLQVAVARVGEHQVGAARRFEGDGMSIETELLEYITKELAPGNPDIDAEASLAGVVDSTAVMELVVWIEGKYGFDVEIDDITPDNFGSVKALTAYIDKNKS